MGLAGSHRPRKGCSSWWPSRVRQEPASIAAIVSSGGTMVGLQMPRAIEILDATLRRLERGEMTALEAIDAQLRGVHPARDAA
jgi:hypothetical protein